jgi:hypothetical protein
LTSQLIDQTPTMNTGEEANSVTLLDGCARGAASLSAVPGLCRVISGTHDEAVQQQYAMSVEPSALHHPRCP